MFDISTKGVKTFPPVSDPAPEPEFRWLLAISDRILVMYEGQIVGEVPPDRSLIEEIGLMMAGKRGGGVDW